MSPCHRAPSPRPCGPTLSRRRERDFGIRHRVTPFESGHIVNA
jgi:hypothetical protein